MHITFASTRCIHVVYAQYVSLLRNAFGDGRSQRSADRLWNHFHRELINVNRSNTAWNNHIKLKSPESLIDFEDFWGGGS